MDKETFYKKVNRYFNGPLGKLATIKCLRITGKNVLKVCKVDKGVKKYKGFSVTPIFFNLSKEISSKVLTQGVFHIAGSDSTGRILNGV